MSPGKLYAYRAKVSMPSYNIVTGLCLAMWLVNPLGPAPYSVLAALCPRCQTIISVFTVAGRAAAPLKLEAPLEP